MKKLFFLLVVLTALTSCKTSKVAVKKPLPPYTTAALNFLNKEKIPGMSISVSRRDTLIWSEGFGFSDLKNKKSVSPKTTLFRIASISKPITAITLGILVDENKVHLDSSVYNYLTSYPKKKYDFTLRQLGGHVAGIRHYRGNEFLINEKLSITEGLNIFKNDPLLFRPQSDYSYSTYNFCLLSEIIQVASKQPFMEYVSQNVFQPLNMMSTILDEAALPIENRTEFYIKNRFNDIVLGPKVNNEYKVAGGGFLSTSEDLLKFGNEAIHPKNISRKTLNELVTSQVLDTGAKTNYGVGFSLGTSYKDTPIYEHSGGAVGASTLLLIYPEEEIVISILTNLSGAPIYELGKQLETIFVK